MRKLFYLLSFFILPIISLADISYTRFLPNNLSSTNIVLDINIDNYEKDINCGGLKFWGVQAIEHETGDRFFGSPLFVSSDILSQKFDFTLPVGDFEELTFICSEDGENEAFQFGSIENNLEGDEVIFITEPDLPSIIDIVDDGVSEINYPEIASSTSTNETENDLINTATTSTETTSDDFTILDIIDNGVGEIIYPDIASSTDSMTQENILINAATTSSESALEEPSDSNNGEATSASVIISDENLPAIIPEEEILENIIENDPELSNPIQETDLIDTSFIIPEPEEIIQEEENGDITIISI